MAPIFLDAGYIIVLEAVDDQNHEVASSYWKSLPKPLPPLITTSYIFDEVVTFFNNRNHHAKATEVGERLLSSPLSNSFMSMRLFSSMHGNYLSSVKINRIR